MIVRCTRILDLPYRDRRELPQWPGGGVTVGAEYLVLEIEALLRQEPTIRIKDDDGTPSFWPAAMFEVVSPRLPSNWVPHITDEGDLYLSPTAWLGTFWDEYMEGYPEARAAYEREFSVIEQER